jgi:hypothetical protein
MHLKDYLIIEAIGQRSKEIQEIQNCLNGVFKLAKRLASTKGGLNVKITLEEAIEVKQDPFAKNNAGPGFILIPVSETGKDLTEKFAGAGYGGFSKGVSSGEDKSANYRRMGLSEEGMPNELALCMLDVVKKYYHLQLHQKEAELKQLIASHQSYFTQVKMFESTD